MAGQGAGLTQVLPDEYLIAGLLLVEMTDVVA
jgi:hypothetical protein